MKDLASQIRTLCKEKNAIIMAHYYTRPEIQEVADFIGDSLALAQKAQTIDADIIILCGVHFMGETAKIICPNKKVIVPDLNAGCSLADSCQVNELQKLKDQYPQALVISYVNTTASVKAITDIVVTSSNAEKIVNKLPIDQQIIFGPDKNLGAYINKVTGRKMILWNGCCQVHNNIQPEQIIDLKKQYPRAIVLAHPECKGEVLEQADVVGSTAALLNYAKSHDYEQYIVVTESSIMHELEKQCPDKQFIPVSAVCEDMRLTTLEKLYDCLRNEQPEIIVDKAIAEKAILPIERMLELS
ncbi:MAG: quinolinate synthase NadA [archaeon]|nr:quinolinate synthase NadA [archaeon]